MNAGVKAAQAQLILAHERQLRQTMIALFNLTGPGGMKKSIDKIQQEISAQMRDTGRQGHGGWIF